MALDMSPQEKTVGKTNFIRSVGQLGLNRRQFMQGMLAGGAVLPITAAAYLGYNNSAFREKPVKAALIGAGDEGGVLVGEHNPAYLEFVAICDIRPSNYSQRIWRGEDHGPRKGLNYHYGNDARRHIRHFTDYRQMLRDVPDIEAVVIALPLHLHAPVAIECMRADKHVLCEKLMAWNISQCKEMIRVADEKNRVLAIGHQRHYSMLYAHANEIVQSGILGDIHHIRALWHRNNARPLMENGRQKHEQINGRSVPMYRDSWRKAVPPEDREALASESALRNHGFKDINELIRWRLYQRTGGGLMVELGSHQLDACSIFLGKVHPLAVSGTGGKYFYEDDREVADHVFCTFEFPGKNYWREEPSPQHPQGVVGDRNDIVVVTYSSINTNSFEPYGECVMGTKGTLVVEKEETAMLWGMAGRSTAVGVKNAGGAAPTIDSSASTGGSDRVAVEKGQNSIGHAPPSRGYREEMEHFAYVIRAREQANERDRQQINVRCDGRTAMADAVMALCANKAMGDPLNRLPEWHPRRGSAPTRIEFQPRWYDAAATGRDGLPDAELTAQGPLPSEG